MERAFSPRRVFPAGTLGVAQGWYVIAPLALNSSPFNPSTLQPFNLPTYTPTAAALTRACNTSPRTSFFQAIAPVTRASSEQTM